jgi:prevent-host-death family protein
MSTNTWTIAEAKARFSQLIERARSNGPQIITRHERTAAVVVSADEWTQRIRRSGNLAEFFAASPLAGSGITVERRRDRARKIDL